MELSEYDPDFKYCPFDGETLFKVEAPEHQRCLHCERCFTCQGEHVKPQPPEDPELERRRQRLKAWTDAVTKVLQDEGFEVTEQCGLPMVSNFQLLSIEKKIKILELALPFDHTKRIYSDGVIFAPAR